jgi:ferredoxin-NADP reductase/MOSC domain-containing protein YiiM
MARLLSVNVGKPKDFAWQGRTVYTGIWKSPVRGPVTARRLNLDGDGQGDLAGHGGEQRAVLVYQVDSLRYWQKFLGRDELEFGAFGENFTVEGLGDDEVCIGDRYRIGSEAEFEVTQPRVTCYRLGMRLEAPHMAAWLVEHHRPGFYLRVITEGRVKAGDEIVRTRRGRHRLSVADADALLYLPDRDRTKLAAAIEIPALSPGWRQSFVELLGQSDAGTAAPAVGVEPGSQPGWPGFRPLRVTKIVPESSTISSVYLASPDDRPLPAAKPGQYLTLRVPEAGQPAPVRSYSLSGTPGGAVYRISVKREGVVSDYLHTKLRPGDSLEAAAPRGEFVLEPGTDPVALISAGVGITPVLAMLHQLAAERAGQQIWWLHSSRNAEQQPFIGEVRQLLHSLPSASWRVFHTEPGAEDGAVAGFVHGRLGPEVLAGLGLPARATAYICGPERFMTDMTKALVDLRLDPGRVRTELFGALAPINPGVTATSRVAPHLPPGEPGTGPLVTFARSGLTVPWNDEPPSATLLELAESCDVPTRWACRSGVCHTCVTQVLSGNAVYQTEPLEPPAEGQLLICSARPDGEIVLDM